MKDKNLKRSLKLVVILIVIMSLVFLGLKSYEKRRQEEIYNGKINSIFLLIEEKYPDVKEDDLVEILNSNSQNKSNILSKYGIDDHSYILALDKVNHENLILEIIFGVVLLSLFIIIFIDYFIRRHKSLKNLEEVIKNIINGDYSLDITSNEEDDITSIRNQLYKVVIKLKKLSDDSLKEKKAIEDSVANISHQLKTPLTSIRIMLDNLQDEDMDKEVRKEFLRDITMRVEHLNFLITSLLKLSRFDAGVVKFKKDNISLDKLIKTISNDLSILLEIKDVKIYYEFNKKVNFVGDLNWEKEALTNIIKNAVEHSYEGGIVKILVDKNNFYTEVKIIDNGCGMSKEEVKNIFKRFYKGSSARYESYGIGLSLAREIIEKDNGSISCSSVKNKGTEFVIKYYN